ncbi:MAG TPA: hypothetical protein VKT75_14450 [Acidobacteriaceae bacterium]|nr:hypothetical protein [Acidobacteriaceae bacterium]
MIDDAADCERLVRCFDPDAVVVENPSDILVISPRFGRIRRQHPLLASTPAALGHPALWQTARLNLLTCRDRSVQLALATYEYRIRMRARFSPDSLRDGRLDLHAHCHKLLDRCGGEKCAVPVRRASFWIRSVPPDEVGNVQFEFGNTFLIPITEAAIRAEARTLLGPKR